MPPGSRSVTCRSHESLTTRRLVTPTAHNYSRTPIIALYVWAYLTLHWNLYAETGGRRWPAASSAPRSVRPSGLNVPLVRIPSWSTVRSVQLSVNLPRRKGGLMLVRISDGHCDASVEPRLETVGAC